MSTKLRPFISAYLKDVQAVDEVCNHLHPSTEEVFFKRGAFLIQEGRRHPYLYVVLKEAIRSLYTKDAKEVNTWFGFEGDLIGSIYWFRNEPSVENMQAMKDCWTMRFPYRMLSFSSRISNPLVHFSFLLLEEYALFLETRMQGVLHLSALQRYHFMRKEES